jgi:hypothetical protein
MAVYSIVLPDSTILKRVAGLKSVIIVGCGACLNDSLSFSTERPLARVISDRVTSPADFMPLLVDEELKRIKKLLENNGLSAEVECMAPLCEISFMTEPFISELAKRSAEAEAIISLSCSVGTLALIKQLGKVFRIKAATKTLGVFQPSKFLDESKEFVFLDKSKSTIIKFK